MTTTEPPSTVSVVIPTRARPDLIVPLARRILAEPELVDLVIATGIGDESVAALEAIRDEDARLNLVVVDPPPSAAQARLAAVQAARGEIVLLLDDDIWPAPGVVAGHARYHRERSDVAVGGMMPVRLTATRLPGQASIRLYAEEWQDNWRAHHDNPLDALWMGHFSVSRDTFVKVEEAQDAWDDAYHEDTDLGLRLIEAGVTGVAADDLHAEHLQQRHLPDALRDAERQARGVVRLAARHPTKSGQLPSYMVEPVWLYRASALMNQSLIRRVVIKAGFTIERAAGRARLWRIETAVVRVLRRLVAMSAIQQVQAGERDGEKRGI
jgi:GT2 family glycosyltransferase